MEVELRGWGLRVEGWGLALGPTVIQLVKYSGGREPEGKEPDGRPSRVKFPCRPSMRTNPSITPAFSQEKAGVKVTGSWGQGSRVTGL